MHPIQAMIDGLFQKLKNAVQATSGHPVIKRLLLNALDELQKSIDALFAMPAGTERMALSPDQIKQLADAVLGLALTLFGSNPTVLAIVSALKLAIDTFLSPRAAALLAVKCG